jgi:DNA sulfur modification protein DndD
MKFLELKLTNWGPYLGDHVIDLKTSETAPVVVIHGTNGRGKTSLMRAMFFALYGRVLDSHHEPIKIENLVSNDALEDSSSANFEVKLTFEHAGVTYEVERTGNVSVSEKTRSLSGMETLFRQKGGVPFPENKVRERINEILDENIADFYLFDGEKLAQAEKKLSKATDESQVFVRKSVERALGLSFLDKLRVDLEEIREQLSQDLAKSQRLQKNSADLLKKIEDSRQELEAKRKDLSELRKLQGQWELELNATQKTLQDFSAVRDLVVERQLLDGSILDLEKEIETLQQGIKEIADRAWIYPLRKKIAELSEQTMNSVRDAQGSKSRRDDLQSQIAVIELSLNHEDICSACGNKVSASKVEENKQTLLKLKSEISDIVEIDLDSALRKNQKLQSLNNRLGDFAVLESKLADLAQKELEIQNHRLRVRELNEKIGSSETPNIVALEDTTQDLKEKLQKCQIGIKATDEAISVLNSAISSHTTKLSNSPEVDQTDRTRIKVVNELLELLSNSYEGFRETMRSQVQDASSKMLKRLSSEKDFTSLSISPKYQVNLIDVDGRTVNLPSSGYSQIVAMSFIAGLAEVAGSQNSVVMDTPWGRLDLENRSLILDWIKSREAQTIIFVQSAELTSEDARSRFAGRLGRQYQIERLTSSTSRIA